jgi:putative methionine-R-sulfoxide reductase with GAF domain
LREILAIPGDRVGRARRIAAAIRDTGGYRWVGIYDVSPEEIAVLAWSGPEAPAHPRFPASKIVVPILDPDAGRAVGLLDVESDLLDAFGQEDRRCLEECAAALAPLWG